VVEQTSDIESAVREVELARQELRAAHDSAGLLLGELEETERLLEQELKQGPPAFRLPRHWREIPDWAKSWAWPWMQSHVLRRNRKALR
jgi:hypothetical protein